MSDAPKYEVVKLEVDDDDTWDAEDWCYVVQDGGGYVCICTTQEEAERICRALIKDEL